MKLSLLCIIGCFLISCSSNEAPTPSEPKDPSIRDTFDLPLDTLAILDMMDIPLSAYHDTILADYELDTFDLIYQMYACDCQRWIEVEEYDKSIDSKNTEYYHLVVSEHGFFIKPAFMMLRFIQTYITKEIKFDLLAIGKKIQTITHNH
jgi:hypothetical protein